MQLTDSFREVFSRPWYVLLAVTVAFVFYSVNILISSWRVFTEFSLLHDFSDVLNLFIFLLVRGGGLGMLHSSLTLICISILLGILFALVVFKTRMNLVTDSSGHTLGVVAVFLAIFVPGCSVCGVGLISALGLSAGFITLLPLDGLELSLLSIALLCIGIVRIGHSLMSCEFSSHVMMKGGDL